MPMTPREVDAFLTRSLEDRRFSRGERQALSEFVSTLATETDREEVRRRAFEVARTAISGPDALLVLGWLEDVSKAIRQVEQTAARPIEIEAESYFSPGEDCPRVIGRLLSNASRTADICVFTITDDRLADAILEAHRRGVAVRIITDDAKAEDLGSDVERFERSGISTRVDRSPFHMHHKFAILDGEKLLTGSYNWTRGAARDNEENLIITTDPRFLSPFKATFDRLWAKLAPSR